MWREVMAIIAILPRRKRISIASKSSSDATYTRLYTPMLLFIVVITLLCPAAASRPGEVADAVASISVQPRSGGLVLTRPWEGGNESTDESAPVSATPVVLCGSHTPENQNLRTSMEDYENCCGSPRGIDHYSDNQISPYGAGPGFKKKTGCNGCYCLKWPVTCPWLAPSRDTHMRCKGNEGKFTGWQSAVSCAPSRAASSGTKYETYGNCCAGQNMIGESRKWAMQCPKSSRACNRPATRQEWIRSGDPEYSGGMNVFKCVSCGNCDDLKGKCAECKDVCDSSDAEGAGLKGCAQLQVTDHDGQYFYDPSGQYKKSPPSGKSTVALSENDQRKLAALRSARSPGETEHVTATVRSDRELAELHSSWIPHDIVEEVTVEEEREKTQEEHRLELVALFKKEASNVVDSGFYVHGTDVVIWYPEGANARYRDRVGWVEDSIGGSRYKVNVDVEDMQELVAGQAVQCRRGKSEFAPATVTSNAPLEVEIDMEDETITSGCDEINIPIVLDETEFFPVLKGEDKPGETRFFHEVEITDAGVVDAEGKSLTGHLGVITKVYHRTNVDHAKDFWEYSAEVLTRTKRKVDLRGHASRVWARDSAGYEEGEGDPTKVWTFTDLQYTELPKLKNLMEQYKPAHYRWECIIAVGDRRIESERECFAAFDVEANFPVTVTIKAKALTEDKAFIHVSLKEGQFTDLEGDASHRTYSQLLLTKRKLSQREEFTRHERTRKRKAQMNAEQYKEYIDSLQQYHDKKFPEKTQIQIEVELAAKKAEQPDRIGRRVGLLNEMTAGLLPEVVQARMLAGDDDQITGIEANVDQWAKNGVMLLGSARNAQRLSDIALHHLERSHKKSVKADLFKEAVVQGHVDRLKKASETMKSAPDAPVID